MTGNVLGGFFGRTIAGFSAEAGGWRSAFVVLGLLTAAGSAATWWLLPAPGRGHKHAVPGSIRSALDMFKEGRLLATFAVGFGVLFTQVATFTFVTFHLAGPRFGFGSGALGAVFLVYLVGAAVTPVAGWWIGRLGPRRILTVSLVAGFLGSALTLWPAVWAVVVGLALSCSASFVNQAAATSYLPGAAGPERRALASGIYISSYYLGGAAGGVVPAAAWAVGGWPACVALVALAQIATLALALHWWRSEGLAAEGPAARGSLGVPPS